MDVNSDRINEMIKESLGAVELKSKENFEIFAAGIADAGDESFKVPDSEVELNGESTEQDIGKAAVAAAFDGVNVNELKEAIWKEVEAHLTKQIEEMEEDKRPSQEQIDGDKKEVKEKQVDGAVDSAFSDKRAELEKAYDPEPEEEEKPEEEDKKEDQGDDAKEEAAEDEKADDGDKEKENENGNEKEEDAAKEEDDKAADDGAKEEDKGAEEEAPKEDAGGDDAAADDAAADDAAADDAGGDEE